MLLFIPLSLLVVSVALLVIFAPTRVRYTEQRRVAAPIAIVYDDIRLQERLMQWSVWPAATKSGCAVEGIDGEIGARTVYLTAVGVRSGYQEIVELVPQTRIVFTLTSPGPIRQQPILTFDLQRVDDRHTDVFLHFANTIARPSNALARLLGIVAWTRTLHRGDLASLQTYSEVRATQKLAG